MIDKLSRIIRVAFQRVPVERLLTLDENKKIYYDNMNLNYLQDLLMTYYQQYSDTEVRMQIGEVQAQMDCNGVCLVYGSNENACNVFSVLFYYTEEVLTIHNNLVVCKYDNLLEWNELARVIGEDIPVSYMIAKRDLDEGRTSRHFSWPPVIGHNNRRLDRILEKGMADNHFHLRGSTPYFFVSWIRLMNHPGRRAQASLLDELDHNFRDKNRKMESGTTRQPFRKMIAQAALIRLYLCSRLTDFPINFSGIWSLDSEIGEDKILDLVAHTLSDDFELEVYFEKIQMLIDEIIYLWNIPDYMLAFVKNEYSAGEDEYQILTGERWFLYNMLKMLRTADDTFSRREYNLFYAYLRIKNELQCELMQVNDIIGFENFSIYQNRKDWFSHSTLWEQSEWMLARLAVHDVLNNPAVRCLEVRISPGNTARENMKYICGYDRAVIKASNEEKEFDKIIKRIEKKFNGEKNESLFKGDDLRQRFYYVFHFTKSPDRTEKDLDFLECRHYTYRKKLLKKAKAIIKFREEYPQYASRVVGIDACAQEIGCRPEVFGRVFRVLRNHTFFPGDNLSGVGMPQLKVTYHVGEDFLDITDGLRAIDEAIRFLNLDCGDRIGHALALGVDAYSWYHGKGNQVTLPLQDYLDNVAWLHHALVKYRIPNMNVLKGWLEEEYSHYFAYIYQIISQEIDQLEREGRQQGNFDINTYYLSLLLRGDTPSLYKDIGCRDDQKIQYVDQWDRHKINRMHRRKDDIREIHEVVLLYHMYHYSKNARKKGSEKRTIHITDDYIEGVALVQKAMRENVALRGIAVETNPSSNIRIGAFKKYEEHPIKTFYNLGLTKNEKELMECPQMNVSVNTDDKGVFSTRLENEYALLACAMEQEMTSEGFQKYKKEFIYEWINNIREMGLQQAFAETGRNLNGFTI